MLVPVAGVGRVVVTVVNKVDVGLVLNGGVTTSLAVLVGMRLMLSVGDLALIPVARVGCVSVSAMDVVSVALMLDGSVTAAGAVGVGMVGVNRVFCGGHLCNSSEWRTASMAMCARCWSVSE